MIDEVSRRNIQRLENIGEQEWRDLKIANALAADRAAVVEVIAEKMIEALESQQAALTDEMKSLRIDLAQLQDAIDDLRHIVNSEYGKIIDLPNPLSTEELKSAAD